MSPPSKSLQYINWDRAWPTAPRNRPNAARPERNLFQKQRRDRMPSFRNALEDRNGVRYMIVSFSPSVCDRIRASFISRRADRYMVSKVKGRTFHAEGFCLLFFNC